MDPAAAWWRSVLMITGELEAARIAYCLIEEAALAVQGVELPRMPAIDISVQWDLFDDAHGLFQPYGAGPVEEHKGSATFSLTRDGIPIHIVCYRNTVVETDPDRVSVEREGRRIWAKSLDFYRRRWPPLDARVERIEAFLRAAQRRQSAASAAAWNQSAYRAWVERHGHPAEAAERIRSDPEARLAALRGYLGDVAGRKIANLLGSYGGKAVALALLGADVTVVDIASENARYALELAHAAGVAIRYVVSDVLALPAEELSGDYDIVLMELGILHYFVDLQPLAQVVVRLLRAGGRMVLQDFHPVSTKLITSRGRKHKVTGNYFDPTPQEADVACLKHLPDASLAAPARVRLRKWTLAETVTAFAEAGLCVRALSEEPNTKIDDIGIPKTFTLVAEKGLRVRG